MKKKKKGITNRKMTADFFKEFYKSEHFQESVGKRNIKGVIETGNVLGGWKESRTVMIPEVKKAKARDLKPTAQLNVGYKIMMTVVRDSLEQHVSRKVKEKINRRDLQLEVGQKMTYLFQVTALKSRIH